MSCAEAREALWPPELPRLLDPRVERARAHVRGCSECAQYFAQDRRFLDTCHRLRTVRAPESVRLRVFDALARTGRVETLERPPSSLRERAGRAKALELDTPGRSGPRPWFGAAGVVATVLGIGLTVFGLGLDGHFSSSGDGPPPEDAFVEDYLRRAVGEDFLESSDREEIARFLQRELGLRSRLLDAPGLVPTRVEICLLEGRRGAMVVYHLEDRMVTHYLVPDQGHARVPSVAESHGDLAVVTWSSGRTEEALVGAFPASELLAMARSDALE